MTEAANRHRNEALARSADRVKRDATARATLRALIVEHGVEDVLRLMQTEVQQIALNALNSIEARGDDENARFITLNFADRMEQQCAALRGAQERAMLADRYAEALQKLRETNLKLLALRETTRAAGATE